MILCIADVLPNPLLAEIREWLHGTAYVDGKTTAGWNAKLVKNNEQVGKDTPRLAEMQGKVVEAVRAHQVFTLASRAKTIRPPLFSRYAVGREYGSHVDDPLMQGMRTDLSCTIFLSDLADYDGGTLIMQQTDGDREVRLPAGSAVLYPSTTLHRVTPVTRGVRLAAVTWIRSTVRSAEQREILFDIDRVRRSIFQAQGKTADFDLLSKAFSNLMRMWVDD
jgi:PKHD-type hydroxylase